MEKVDELIKIIQENDNIVFLTGAGVSVASGIPDFRSSNGVYEKEYYSYRPEEILSHTFFMKHTDEFYKFYKEKMIYKNVLPNVIHKTMAKLTRIGKAKAVITQNIDGLDLDAGCKEVIELHGTVRKNSCISCGKKYDLDYILESNDVPTCSCKGIVKPLVTLYEEGLDYNCLEKSIEYIINAKVLIVVGSSLLVNPAASLINYFKGKHLIIINLSETPYDRYASLVINEDASKVFSKIWERF